MKALVYLKKRREGEKLNFRNMADRWSTNIRGVFLPSIIRLFSLDDTFRAQGSATKTGWAFLQVAVFLNHVFGMRHGRFRQEW